MCTHVSACAVCAMSFRTSLSYAKLRQYSALCAGYTLKRHIAHRRKLVTARQGLKRTCSAVLSQG